jgi:hypothetical protein
MQNLKKKYMHFKLKQRFIIFLQSPRRELNSQLDGSKVRKFKFIRLENCFWRVPFQLTLLIKRIASTHFFF